MRIAYQNLLDKEQTFTVQIDGCEENKRSFIAQPDGQMNRAEVLLDGNNTCSFINGNGGASGAFTLIAGDNNNFLVTFKERDPKGALQGKSRDGGHPVGNMHVMGFEEKK